ncbi:MAG: hypothetical protein BGO95_07645 [Micrococcales bacterium 73-13]|nr:MAG: hypothetical protein BGO95_07645 [Micrococcales bacterium 73-13]
MTAAQPQAPRPIDTRGPRFSAGVTFVLALAALLTGLLVPIERSWWLRVLSPEFLLLLVAWLNFAIGTVWGVGANPFGAFFRAVIRPRLRKPAETEDPRPPHFALGVGFALSTIGLVLHLIGVPWGLVVAAALIVVASFLNAFVGYCLGCQVYLLLARSGVIRPRPPLAT